MRWYWWLLVAAVAWWWLTKKGGSRVVMRAGRQARTIFSATSGVPSATDVRPTGGEAAGGGCGCGG